MKEESAKFGFCVHSHQPAGNLRHVLEKVFMRSYEPFFRLMGGFPEIKFNAHFSGYLLEWMIEEEPEYVEGLVKMVKKGQVEILGGGFYEPIIPSIPAEDAVGQIKEFGSLIKKTFGHTPRGMWLAERVWEPNLPEILSRSNVEYTLVDDLGFINAGIPRERLAGYYTLESGGKEVSIFPINIQLRDSIPFSGYTRAANLIQKASSRNSGKIAVFGDDCEKFGSWPGTYSTSYEKKWLAKFMRLLISREIETWHFSEYLDSFQSSGMAYLPACSYPEMMKWAMMPEGQKKGERLLKQRGVASAQFIIGAPWRNFLMKYSESMQIYRKIKFVSEMVSSGGNREELTSLYMGEANDSLWHGVFGGIYLPLLRMNSFSNLIRAQSLAEKRTGKEEYIRKFENVLFGSDSFCMSTKKMWAHVGSQQGLELLELDLRDECLNLTDTMTRRKEAYHESIERGLKSGSRTKGNIGKGVFVKNIGDGTTLSYDNSPRTSFKDRILSNSETSKEIMESQGERISGKTSTEFMENSAKISAQRSYSIFHQSGELSVVKSIVLNRETEEIGVNSDLNMKRPMEENKLFGNEINLSSFAFTLKDVKINGRHPETMKVNETSGGKVTVDYIQNHLRIIISSPQSKKIYSYPIETISNSEEGLETIFQGICILPVTDISNSSSLTVSLSAAKI